MTELATQGAKFGDSNNALWLKIATALQGAASLVPTTLIFSTQPAGAVVDVPFAQQPVVTVKDQNGNTLTSFQGKVYVYIATAEAGGSVTALDSATLTPEPGEGANVFSMLATNGVAAFPDLEITTAGDYTLGVYVAETAATPAQSDEFEVLDVDAASYITRRATAGDVLSAADKTAFNSLVTTLKSGGQWNKLVEFWTPLGGTFSGALVKLKDSGSGNCVNHDFVSGDFDPVMGLLGDGTSKYLATGTTPGDHGVTGNNQALGVFVSGNEASSAGDNVGFGDGSSFFFPAFAGTIIFGGVSIPNSSNIEGFHILFREAGDSKYYHGGILMSSTTTGANAPAVPVDLGRYGDGFYYTRRMRCYFIGAALTGSDAVAITEAFETFVGEVAASRRTGLYVPFGDSITAGLSASDLAHEYGSLVAGGVSLTLNKQGITGTPLVGSHAVDTNGQWSVISRLCDRLPTKVTMAYGTNDVNSADVGVTSVVFQTSCEATLARIKRMTGLPGSAITITGPSRVTSYAGQGDDTRALAFAAAAQAAATAQGCAFAGVRAAMITAGVTPDDGTHPDDDGHEVWADTILTALGF